MKCLQGFNRIHDSNDDPLVVHSYPRSQRESIIIFVHGLNGKRYATWAPPGSTAHQRSFPKFLYEDLQCDIGMYAYRTGFGRLHFSKSISLEREAQVFADTLRDISPYKSIILIGHSMGGLLVCATVRELLSRNDVSTLFRIGGLFLMATPLAGSLRVPRLLWWLFTDTRALHAHGPLVTYTATSFTDRTVLERNHARGDEFWIPRWCVSAAEDWWVDQLSASLSIPSRYRKVVRGSHTSIVKPPDKQSDAYQWVLQQIKHLLIERDKYSAGQRFLSQKGTEAIFSTSLLRLAITRRDITQMTMMLDAAPPDAVSEDIVHAAILSGHTTIWTRHDTSTEKAVQLQYSRGLMLRGELVAAWSKLWTLLDRSIDPTERLLIVRYLLHALNDSGAYAEAHAIAVRLLELSDSHDALRASGIAVMCDLIRVSGKCGNFEDVRKYGAMAIERAFTSADHWREQIASIEVSLAYARAGNITAPERSNLRRDSAINRLGNNYFGLTNLDLISAHDAITTGNYDNANRLALIALRRIEAHGFMFAAGLELHELLSRGCTLPTVDEKTVQKFACQQHEQAVRLQSQFDCSTNTILAKVL